MGQNPHIYGYENEPSNERPTGFGQTNFGQSGFVASTTAAAPWIASQHSTFDQPSRAIDKVQTLRAQHRRRNTGLVAVVLMAVAVIASAAALAMHS